MNQPTIFIIEDDPVYSKVINLMLSKNGYSNVHSFSSGEEAIKSLSLNPHFIILDFSLGGLNGLDILKMIKKKNPSSKVIILTSVTNEELAERCIEFGAMHYLEKNDASIQLILDLLSKTGKKLKRKFRTVIMVSIVIAIAAVLAIYALV